MSIRRQYPNIDADIAMLRAGDNDLSQILAGSVHSDGVTGNVVYTVAAPGQLTYADALDLITREDTEP